MAEFNEPNETLNLVVKGLLQVERQLLDGLVRVSQRGNRNRTQRLTILDESRAHDADLLLIDTRDPAATAWAQQQHWLSSKPVIWIDANSVSPGHTIARRPVQWPVLPIMLARAIEQGPKPASVAKDAPRERPRAAISAIQPLPQILVVDDSAMVRIQVRGFFEKRGFGVTEADHVEAALRLVAEQDFDCILMDVLMPGIDGYDGCRRIKSNLRGRAAVPVVMLTSKSSPFDRIRGKMAGCDAYLTKPIDPEELSKVIAQHVYREKPATPTALEALAAYKPHADALPQTRPQPI